MSRKLLKSTAIVSAMTFLSRISGLLRDVLFARIFGATAATDAFFIAFKIPNFLRRLFAEGAFSQAFVPVLSEYKTQQEHQAVQHLVQRVSGSLGLVLFVVTAIGIVSAPILVMVFAPGFIGDADKLELTAHMLRITFPYIAFISLTALAAGVLNSYGQFAGPAITPVLLNLALIGAALWLAPLMERPVVALAWGVFIAGLLQLLFQLPFLVRLKLLHWPRWGWHDPGVQKIIKLMLPAIFGSSVQQLNLLFDILIASFLVAGSISWLYYADRLVEFPFGVFGVAIATVILPSLSAKHAEFDPKQFSRMLDWALRWSMMIGAPAAVGLIILSGPMIITVFQYGAFDARHVHMTQIALIAYSFGLLGFMFVKVLAPGYFARQNTKTPVKIAIIAVAIKIILTLLFIIPMVRMEFAAPHAGLALATALSALANSWLLLRGLRKEGVYHPQPGWSLFVLRILLACSAMSVVLYYGALNTSIWLHWTAFERAWHLLLWVAGGGAVYIFTLTLLGVRPAQLMHRER